MSKDLLKAKVKLKQIHLQQTEKEKENAVLAESILAKKLETDSFQILSFEHVVSFRYEMLHYRDSFLSRDTLQSTYHCEWETIEKLVRSFSSTKNTPFIIYSIYPAKYPVVIVESEKLYQTLDTLFELFEEKIAIVSSDYCDALFIDENLSTEEAHCIKLYGNEINRLLGGN